MRRNSPIEKEFLIQLYVDQQLSAKEIADKLGSSHNRVDYYMQKYGIARRSISEAVYIRRNPTGNPFTVKTHLSQKLRQLKSLGLGLY